MRPRRLVTVIATGNALAYAVILVLSGRAGRYATPLEEFVASTPPIAASCVVGALLAVRRPGNPIGWLFLLNATIVTSTGISSAWAGYALTHPGTLPGGRFMAIWDSAAWPLDWVALIAIVLVFPDGRSPFRHSRRALALILAALALVVIAGILGPNQPADLFRDVEPYGVVGKAVTNLALTAGLALMAWFCVFGAITVRRRFRTPDATLRLQLKWLVYAAMLVPITIVTAALDVTIRGVSDPGNATLVVFVCLEIALPAAVGVAVLRYRLYEIDRLINRTLVYGTLTALLGGAYVGSILVLQLILSPSSDVAIVASTLGVAGLFRPARSRVQAGVDQRFFRRQYDARRTLAGFSTRLRDEVSLDAIEAELDATVSDAMQPAHLSVWLRPR